MEDNIHKGKIKRKLFFTILALIIAVLSITIYLTNIAGFIGDEKEMAIEKKEAKEVAQCEETELMKEKLEECKSQVEIQLFR